MSEKRKYDSTVARIAGNIASAWADVCRADTEDEFVREIAQISVRLAREIVAEVERTELAVRQEPEAP